MRARFPSSTKMPTWRENLRFAVGALSLFFVVMLILFSMADFAPSFNGSRLMFATASAAVVLGLFWAYLRGSKTHRMAVANQLPDPTSPSVTPPAGAGRAPSVATDH